MYEGCIEEVRSGQVFLKFDEAFQRQFAGELYHVDFRHVTPIEERRKTNIISIFFIAKNEKIVQIVFFFYKLYVGYSTIV